MNTKVNNQPILAGVLAVFLIAVLYLTSARDSSPSESGFDAPENLGLLESELVPEPTGEWQAPENQRNPFVGPFSTESGFAESGPENTATESVADSE